MNHKYSTVVLILILLLIPIASVIGKIVSEEIDEGLCNVSGSVLYRSPSLGTWGCANLMDSDEFNVTVNNITNIFTNFSLYSNQSNYLLGEASNSSYVPYIGATDDVALGSVGFSVSGTASFTGNTLFADGGNIHRFDGDINAHNEINQYGANKNITSAGSICDSTGCIGEVNPLTNHTPINISNNVIGLNECSNEQYYKYNDENIGGWACYNIPVDTDTNESWNVFDQDLNTTDNVTFVRITTTVFEDLNAGFISGITSNYMDTRNIKPRVNNSYDLGAPDPRYYRDLYLAGNIHGYPNISADNLTANYLFGNGSFLTGIVSSVDTNLSQGGSIYKSINMNDTFNLTSSTLSPALYIDSSDISTVGSSGMIQVKGNYSSPLILGALDFAPEINDQNYIGFYSHPTISSSTVNPFAISSRPQWSGTGNRNHVLLEYFPSSKLARNSLTTTTYREQNMPYEINTLTDGNSTFINRKGMTMGSKFEMLAFNFTATDWNNYINSTLMTFVGGGNINNILAATGNTINTRGLFFTGWGDNTPTTGTINSKAVEVSGGGIFDWSGSDISTFSNVSVEGNFTGNQLYAEMYFHNDTASGNPTVISVQGDWYNLSGFQQETEIGQTLNGFTFSSNSNAGWLTTQVGGLYKLDYSISFQRASGGASREFKTIVAINENVQENTEVHRLTGTATDVGNVGGTGFLQLAVGDVVTILITNEDGTENAGTHSTNINLVRIGT